MKLIVISPPENIQNETEIVNALFEAGLEIFHVHKPSFSDEEIENYIRGIHPKYRDRVALHAHFQKFHSLEELEKCNEKFEYAFLSPIFGSISKDGYKSNFNLQDVKSFLDKRKAPSTNKDIDGALIALGGIDEDKIEIANELGFAGVAVLGALWQSNNPIEKFNILKDVCCVSKRKKLLISGMHP